MNRRCISRRVGQRVACLQRGVGSPGPEPPRLYLRRVHEALTWDGLPICAGCHPIIPATSRMCDVAHRWTSEPFVQLARTGLSCTLAHGASDAHFQSGDCLRYAASGPAGRERAQIGPAVVYLASTALSCKRFTVNPFGNTMSPGFIPVGHGPTCRPSITVF